MGFFLGVVGFWALHGVPRLLLDAYNKIDKNLGEVTQSLCLI